MHEWAKEFESMKAEIEQLKKEKVELADNILRIVDDCFHAYASSYRSEARELAENEIGKLSGG